MVSSDLMFALDVPMDLVERAMFRNLGSMNTSGGTTTSYGLTNVPNAERDISRNTT